MSKISHLAVFCGARTGLGPIFVEEAKQVAKFFAEQQINLIYGGGRVGIMGVIADAMLEHKQQVIGVIPQFLVDREVTHNGVTKLHIVNNMHERKALMHELADGFILFPGGIGSLEEFFEILSWGQLGLHNKPCGILNVDGYFDAMIEFLDHATHSGFIAESMRQMIVIENSITQLLKRFQEYQPPRHIRHIKSIDQT